jgi:hypothetical protein
VSLQWEQFGRTVFPESPIRTNNSYGSYDARNPLRNRYLNINAFVDPAPLPLEIQTHCQMSGRAESSNENISMMKLFPIRENMRLGFGADAFNVFNGHLWSGLNADIDNAGGWHLPCQAI